MGSFADTQSPYTIKWADDSGLHERTISDPSQAFDFAMAHSPGLLGIRGKNGHALTFGNLRADAQWLKRGQKKAARRTARGGGTRSSKPAGYCSKCNGPHVYKHGRA